LPDAPNPDSSHSLRSKPPDPHSGTGLLCDRKKTVCPVRVTVRSSKVPRSSMPLPDPPGKAACCIRSRTGTTTICWFHAARFAKLQFPRPTAGSWTAWVALRRESCPEVGHRRLLNAESSLLPLIQGQESVDRLDPAQGPTLKLPGGTQDRSGAVVEAAKSCQKA